MPTTASATLWADTARTRFFVIPDEAKLPPGDLTLRTITGGRREIDPSSVSTFEVTEEQAREWVKGQFGQLLDSARGAVDRFVDRLRGAVDDPVVVLSDPIAELERAIGRLSSSAPPSSLVALADRLALCEARLRALAIEKFEKDETQSSSGVS